LKKITGKTGLLFSLTLKILNKKSPLKQGAFFKKVFNYLESVSKTYIPSSTPSREDSVSSINT
jgi:hypothetical protein